MEKSIDYAKLVEQAQLGDSESAGRLAEAVRERLYAYVYRYTLCDDLTHDITQETILKMLETLGKLRDGEQFWPWLCKIALNKIRLHHRNLQRHKTSPNPDEDYAQSYKDSQEAISGMVYQEFKEIVFATMQELKPEHRFIINMRCYDQMQYSEIAKIMDRSEFAAQKLFYRAKKILKKKLVRRGLGKGSLMIALVLFGKLTAPSTAAASGISITTATVKVSTAASLAAILATKAAVISLTTAGALTIGTMVAPSISDSQSVASVGQPAMRLIVPKAVDAQKDSRQYWYYYPTNASDTVMMRVIGKQAGANNQYSFLQNAKGNYHYDSSKNTVYIENYHQWQSDFSVWRLPTDSFKLTDFLTEADGRARPTEDVYRNSGNMLLVVKQPGKENNEWPVVTRHENVLGEDYFKYDWPANVKVVDNRDAMHKRGWTFFNVSGKIDNQNITGVGRLPFVYEQAGENFAWMELSLKGQRFVDFSFDCFARPWQGLHTIDVIRRDAAEKNIKFITELNQTKDTAFITLHTDSGKLIYTIDLKRDVVISIKIAGNKNGIIKFEYLDEIETLGSQYRSPEYRETNTGLWNVLTNLGNG